MCSDAKTVSRNVSSRHEDASVAKQTARKQTSYLSFFFQEIKVNENKQYKFSWVVVLNSDFENCLGENSSVAV